MTHVSSKASVSVMPPNITAPARRVRESLLAYHSTPVMLERTRATGQAVPTLSGVAPPLGSSTLATEATEAWWKVPCAWFVGVSTRRHRSFSTFAASPRASQGLGRGSCQQREDEAGPCLRMGCWHSKAVGVTGARGLHGIEEQGELAGICSSSQVSPCWPSGLSPPKITWPRRGTVAAQCSSRLDGNSGGGRPLAWSRDQAPDSSFEPGRLSSWRAFCSAAAGWIRSSRALSALRTRWYTDFQLVFGDLFNMGSNSSVGAGPSTSSTQARHSLFVTAERRFLQVVSSTANMYAKSVPGKTGLFRSTCWMVQPNAATANPSS
mmetsp:Transcript_11678/g.22157  ORF Transcript_11678/g.22157 Transcript_11678/m.22157 type:complete len:322 (+) Transcript_11678:1250-2215(+)